MTFKYYELRLLAGADDTYEIVKWDKHHKTCSVICFLKYDSKKRCYDVENVGMRPFEACANTKGFAGWIQKIVETLNYVRIFEDEDDFEE